MRSIIRSKTRSLSEAIDTSPAGMVTTEAARTSPRQRRSIPALASAPSALGCRAQFSHYDGLRTLAPFIDCL